MLVLIWLAFAQAQPGDCEAPAFRAAAAADAAERYTGEHPDRLALVAYAEEQRKLAAGCASTASPPCVQSASRESLVAAQTRIAVVAAVDRAQEHETIPTSLDQAREASALGARELGADAGADVRAAHVAALAQAAEAAAEAERSAAARAAAEADLRRAERAWIDASNELSRARCGRACDTSACAVPARDARDLAVLRALYDDLVSTDADFLAAWSPAALADRVADGGAGGATQGVAVARAAWLRRALADGAARPAGARAKLAQFLATVDGAGPLGPDAARTLIAWLAFERAWRRATASLPGRVDAVIAAWQRVDAATTQRAKLIARDRLLVATRALEATGVTPP